MTNKKLEWKYLLPDLSDYAAIFNRSVKPAASPMAMLQPRLLDGLTEFCSARIFNRFMLLTAKESEEYFRLISETLVSMMPLISKPFGSRYTINGVNISQEPAITIEDNFASRKRCAWSSWIEHDQLFGSLGCYRKQIYLQPGLVHIANGGILILGAMALINRPMLWFRLKHMILQQRFEWLSPDINKSLPFIAPSMPLDLRLIIIGDHRSFINMNTIEPELSKMSLYGEFELELNINNKNDMYNWCGWINTLAQQNDLGNLTPDAWPVLIKQSARYSGDQFNMPLCPQWITRRLQEASLYVNEHEINAYAFSYSDKKRTWRESYLREQMKKDITEGQVIIETDGKVIGQVNALSILDLPSHPLSFGEPSRISCVVHLGDGEMHDVEDKAELCGNIHVKGMMIMHAFLMASLELDHQMPFSASIVFEQSYGEVDGDSASLAELVAIISALSKKAINQQIAVTGSIDQFGRVQSVGGINEKIEGFWSICHTRGFTGTQGVIIPATNVRHLCLQEEVIESVREGKFALWPVKTVNETLEILTSMPFNHYRLPSIITSIRERISTINLHDRQRRPWCLRWMKYWDTKD